MTTAAIADQDPVGICVSRAPDGVFVYANDAFQRIIRPTIDARAAR
jgi:hypothetical protein